MKIVGFRVNNGHVKSIGLGLKEKEARSIARQIAARIKDNYSEFIENKENLNKLYIKAGTIVATTTVVLTPLNVLASETVSSKIIGCFDPVIEILSGVGYPVANAALIIGCLMVCTGRKKQGMDVIKYACIGYLGIQFVPFLLKMLSYLGSELRGMTF